MLPILKIANRIGLKRSEIELYGDYKAKVNLSVLDRLKNRQYGKLIVVTAMTPTSQGEGKTCTAIGLTQALGKLNKRAILTLRQPSLGPLFGVKGGATGSGLSCVLPSEEINLHFTGDLHAISTAHNLLASLVDNHIFQGNALRIDPSRGGIRRCIDITDRQLRHIVVGLGGKTSGIPRETGFDITAASEIMAILSLAKDLKDLKIRLGNIIVGYTYSGNPVFARQLKSVNALAVVLKDAIKPNFVQTKEYQAALVHTGPFANISHGNSSILSITLGLRLADYVITESGFGADLGFEKFCNLVCRQAHFKPSVAVVVVSTRAVRFHGLSNIGKHINIVRRSGVIPIVAINKFPEDNRIKLKEIEDYCNSSGIDVSIVDVVKRGSMGGLKLAGLVVGAIRQNKTMFKFLYPLNTSIKEKIALIANKIYGAKGVMYTKTAEDDIKAIEGQGFGRLPVNIAKTHLSLSDDPKLTGEPKDWCLHIESVRLSFGAGFIVAMAPKMMFMPGLPKRPLCEKMSLTSMGKVKGLF